MRRIALYARVSTSEQTPEPQLHALREYADRRGLEVVEYVDHGTSGARRSRPALGRLLETVRKCEVDAVAVVKLDRLARSVHHLCELAADFKAKGVALVVLDQGIDTTTSSGRLLFHVLSSIAEFERDLIRERVTAGLAAARRKGSKIGRPRALDAKQRERALRLAGSGKSQRAIAVLLETSQATVARVLREAGARQAA
jgi:DNA invertase Pin-like site-specific DNA recombinase